MNTKNLLAIVAILITQSNSSNASVPETSDSHTSIPNTAMSHGARNIRDKFLDFIDFEKESKSGWLKYATAYDNARMDLVIKHSNEEYDLWKKSMEKSFKSEESNSDENLERSLDIMIKLHEKQSNEWRELCNNWHEIGTVMGKIEREQLEKSFKQQPEDDLTIEVISF